VLVARFVLHAGRLARFEETGIRGRASLFLVEAETIPER
jgi:hypothetical protein